MLKGYSISFAREGQPELHFVTSSNYATRETSPTWDKQPNWLVVFSTKEEARERISEMLQYFKHDPERDAALKYIGKVRPCNRALGLFIYEDTLGVAFLYSTPIGDIVTAEGKLIINQVEMSALEEISIT